jgi:hypothetical protein
MSQDTRLIRRELRKGIDGLVAARDLAADRQVELPDWITEYISECLEEITRLAADVRLELNRRRPSS